MFIAQHVSAAQARCQRGAEDEEDDEDGEGEDEPADDARDQDDLYTRETRTHVFQHTQSSSKKIITVQVSH